MVQANGLRCDEIEKACQGGAMIRWLVVAIGLSVATTPVLERKVRVAEYASAEKVLLFPRMDYYNHIDNAHVGATADLVNDIKNPGCYHMAPIVFLYNFFVYQNTNWVFVDPSAIFEEWASVFGAGPGFGLRFLWHLVEQFA